MATRLMISWSHKISLPLVQAMRALHEDWMVPPGSIDPSTFTLSHRQFFSAHKTQLFLAMLAHL